MLKIDILITYLSISIFNCIGGIFMSENEKEELKNEDVNKEENK